MYIFSVGYESMSINVRALSTDNVHRFTIGPSLDDQSFNFSKIAMVSS